jgi:hypothetical protein
MSARLEIFSKKLICQKPLPSPNQTVLEKPTKSDPGKKVAIYDLFGTRQPWSLNSKPQRLQVASTRTAARIVVQEHCHFFILVSAFFIFSPARKRVNASGLIWTWATFS